tara:strand:+ start:26680 stop:27363 length:684 start_codon:yes stop_codon:yes gene_type:complete
MNYRDIIVFDFETGSRNPYKTQPTQIAAVAIHGRKLTIQPGGIFNSEIRPILDDDKAIEMGLDPVEDEALAVTRKTREELAKAPQLKTVWKKFSNFVNKYNFKKTNWTAPIPAGYNIIGFDMPIVERMCSEHGPTNAKNGRQGLFNPIYKIDLMDTVWLWMENNADVKSLSMDSMRDLLGMSKENAHDAKQDVLDTANLMIAFMKLHRRIAPTVKFEKAFADGNIHL